MKHKITSMIFVAILCSAVNIYAAETWVDGVAQDGGGGGGGWTESGGISSTSNDVNVNGELTVKDIVYVRNSDGTVGFEMRPGGSGLNNTYIGADAGKRNSTGPQDVFLGYAAGSFATDADDTTLVGFGSGYSITTADDNTALGSYTLFATTTGEKNTAIGTFAQRTNTLGYSNVAVGWSAMYDCTTGYDNTGVGTEALANITTGNKNTALGYQSNLYNLTGTGNVAVGMYSQVFGESGDNNTSAGYGSLYSVGTGSNNTVIGYEAGHTIDDGDDGNVMLGYQAGYNETGSNKLYIDNSSTTHPLIGGDFSTNDIEMTGDLSVSQSITVGESLFMGDGTSASQIQMDGSNFQIMSTGEINLSKGAVSGDTWTVDTEILTLDTASSILRSGDLTLNNALTVDGKIYACGEVTVDGDLNTTTNRLKRKIVTGDYTLLNADYVLLCNGASDLTISLPLSTSFVNDGFITEYRIKNASSTSNVKVQCTGGDTFKDELTYITLPYKGEVAFIGGSYDGWARLSNMHVVTLARRTSSQTVDGSAVAFDITTTETLDEVISHDAITNNTRLTFGKKGLYGLNYSFDIDSTGGGTWVVEGMLKKNGSEISGTKRRTGNYANEDQSCALPTTWVELDKDDYIELYVDDPSTLTGNLVAANLQAETDI